ncbi:recQ-mediated genome instability protein 1-like [Trifolium pratense]|uniref:RecQ-mediated genome instability protein 1 n=1 Tax=Trifolium pratense TaxID=57577 RepID=A0A2K3P208_TRIPR|nr:recQ-mediated genome instability protein 1-like [Trifolium pratense]
MHIRRLRLDDDDEEDAAAESVQPQPQPQTATHQTENNSNFPSPAVEISDDDFIDISDDLVTPPPIPEPQASDCPVNDFLRGLGFGLKRDSLATCLRELGDSVNGFQGFDVATKAKLCFEQFLFSDLNFCGSGVLPPNVESMHLDVLPGPYVLQVDEILNITCPLRSRYQEAPPGLKRCLKLSMTDGIQRVFGMEYRPIKALDVCASSGLKVAISNVQVRRGLLMLVPETIEVLGGLVERLDAARKRLVDELNKPARGNRTRNGVLPPLATRATLAAWPSSTDTVQANNQGTGHNIPGTGNNLTTEYTSRMGAHNATSNSIPRMVPNVERTNIDMRRQQGASVTTEYTSRMGAQNATSNSIPHMVSNEEPINIDMQYQRGASITTEYNSRMGSHNATSNSIPHMVSNVERMNIDMQRQQGARMTTEDASPMDEQIATSNSIPHMVSNVEPMNIDMQRGTIPVSHNSSTGNRTSSIAEEMHIDTANITRENSVCNRSSHMNSNVATTHEDTIHVTGESSVTIDCSPVSEKVETERDRVPVVTDNTPLNGSSSSTVFNNEDILMDDANDNPLILSGDREVPFTYLASLSAKWAAMKETDPLVRGKIKCFLTGVKGFQFKKRTTYELQAYVDDGSLISEILIDHDVVQKGIGYSPVEVTAALSSSDMNIAQNMKETMRKFQAFLANFEGVILVELNRKYSLPLALDMSQGCPKSDAWSLLRRLKSHHPAQAQKHFPSDTIVLSP